AYNIIGDLPGTTLRNQIVLAGAHLDSWHGATGAGDNAAGVAVVMEAVRILKAVGARPRRTIRIGLWSGEEQGLLGSKAYVERHFVTRAKPKPGVSPFAPEMRNRPFRVKKAHAQLSAYFNLDNGTGKIRGIYAEGNAAAAAIFRAWLRPFHDLDATLVTLRPTVATDHRSFDEVGLPGFQFVQDRLDYFPRLHHTNIDGYDHIYSEELMQASVIMAAFLYHAATRQSRLPRKPMPTFPGRAKASGSAKSPARTGPVRTGPGRGQAPARPGPRPVSRPR
ncbi:MAG: M20/M25/M40 family metallo-hydrolase, partial [Myxococcota bacterium]